MSLLCVLPVKLSRATGFHHLYCALLYHSSCRTSITEAPHIRRFTSTCLPVKSLKSILGVAYYWHGTSQHCTRELVQYCIVLYPETHVEKVLDHFAAKLRDDLSRPQCDFLKCRFGAERNETLPAREQHVHFGDRLQHNPRYSDTVTQVAPVTTVRQQ